MTAKEAIDELNTIKVVYSNMRKEYSTCVEALDMAIEALKGHDSDMNDGDMIYRQAAIKEFNCCELTPDGGIDVNYAIDFLNQLPSAQPERLTDDDFETIRIHLNAYKEKLCNQQRWKEAEEYQRIIDRFMAFASAQSGQPEIIRCKDCRHYNAGFECLIEGYGIERDREWYCGDAERRTDESD